MVKGSGGVGPSRTSHARIDVLSSGEVEVYTEVSPHGQGTETTFAQIAADVLGVSPRDIRVRHSDTDQLPDGQGTYASRGLTVGGSAVYVGLQEARQALLHMASRMLECAPEDVVLQESLAYNRHYPQQPLDLPQIVAFAQQSESAPNHLDAGLSFPIAYTLADNPYAFGAHVAVVSIDRDTGELTCLRYVAVHDAGPLINPLLSRGQIHGGIVQGIGQALTECMAYTDAGQPLNGSLMDYAAPRAGTCPEMIVDTIETPATTNPMGINGIGELPTVAAPAAMASAVLDALAQVGAAAIDMPFTAEKIWRALHGR